MKNLKKKGHGVTKSSPAHHHPVKNDEPVKKTYREGDSGASEREAKRGGYREADTGTSEQEAKRGGEERRQPEKSPASSHLDKTDPRVDKGQKGEGAISNPRQDIEGGSDQRQSDPNQGDYREASQGTKGINETGDAGASTTNTGDKNGSVGGSKATF